MTTFPKEGKFFQLISFFLFEEILKVYTFAQNTFFEDDKSLCYADTITALVIRTISHGGYDVITSVFPSESETLLPNLLGVIISLFMFYIRKST